MEFMLNGKPAVYSGGPDKTLLRYLRDEAGSVSVKDGCSGQGFCGACLVEMDGKPVLSCVTPMKKVEGTRVRTLEGFPEDVKAAVARVFVQEGAVQCGFCTPGILTRILMFLDTNPEPTRQEVVKALSGHFCRCTGYTKIFEAVEKAASLLRSGVRGSAEKKAAKTSPADGSGTNCGGPILGTSRQKYKGIERALGREPFTDDIVFSGMLHGVLLFSRHPRARIIRIHTEKAENLPGVSGVFTARHIPGNRITGLIKKDWPMMIAEGETTGCIGDVLAVVAASDRETAEKAGELIEVEYEVLSPVTDPVKALAGGAAVHEGGNLLEETLFTRGGDIDEAFAASAFIARGRYTTQRIEHAFLECETAVAKPLLSEKGQKGVEVFVQSQGVYEDRRQIADILGIEEDGVVVNLLPAGGGFGGKEDLSVQHHAALWAFLLAKPIKIRLTREESIRMHPKRHPMVMDYELGCSKDGKLTALRARIIGDTGAYASVGMKVLERAAGHATGAYHVPVVDIEAKAVYTNNVPCGAMRGFGVNQTAFAMESSMDELCEAGGFDRWQFRYDNALTEGSVTATGQVLEGGVGVRACLDALKERYGEHKNAGLACAIKNSGIGNGMTDESDALVEIFLDERGDARVLLHHGWTEMGQGVDTMALQIFCEETGVHPDLVDVKVCTRYEAKAGMTTASRASVLLGAAVRDAAMKVTPLIREKGLKALAGQSFRGHWACDWTTKPGAPGKQVTHFGYGYAAQLVILDEKGRVKKIIAAHDAGKVINPALFEGQIQGAVLMGLGYAISENLPMENGHISSYRMKDLGLLRAGDVPEMEVIAVEVPDPVGPYGIKGVGEIGLVPTAAAYANAWYVHSGERIRTLPAGCGKKGGGGNI